MKLVAITIVLLAGCYGGAGPGAAKGAVCSADAACSAGLVCDDGVCGMSTGSGGTEATGGTMATGGNGQPCSTDFGCDEPGDICAAGSVWCPGCSPGEGSCSTGGCLGCTEIEECASVATLEECNARGDCHAVFEDLQDCRCAAIGCCARFLSCAQRPTADCDGASQQCMTIEPYCDSPAYVVSYSGACYEGCVRPEDCR